MAVPPSIQDPPLTMANAGRVAAFLVVLALTVAGGWQAGRILDPPPPPAPDSAHGHP
ncbi:hypothetical protein [Pseudonocardia alaniniphila]|uniref:Uncharacterized protein n=1 Tax=Pseudonocardia alaniniphila TaxID=75291 RepID=A0ABS9TNW8_9PSEU|nr:hypothetical protein [Pseudonocardia alaniniphila]MCH6170078.1 hypothetical protein [Pseudonocardia alaniniphila]